MRWSQFTFMNKTFLEYFRCPERYVRFAVKDGLSEDCGFFQFGRGVVGYGRYARAPPGRFSARPPS